MLKGQSAAMCMRIRGGAVVTLVVAICMALGATIGGLAVPRSALAQDSAPLTVDVADCVKLDRPEDRLACFEDQVAEAEQARRPAEPNLSPAEPAARSAGESASAQSEPRTRRQQSSEAAAPPTAAERRSAPRESQEFTGTIAALQETIPDSYTITLENGQVWRQMQPKRYALQPGYEVRIYSSRWGNSYRLSSPILNGFIQVERVR